jgi:hypothetical protein
MGIGEVTIQRCRVCASGLLGGGLPWNLMSTTRARVRGKQYNNDLSDLHQVAFLCDQHA